MKILKYFPLSFLAIMIISLIIFWFTKSGLAIHFAYFSGILFIISYGTYIILKKE